MSHGHPIRILKNNLHDASLIKINHLGGTENSGFPLSPQDQYDNKTYCGLGIYPSANLIPVLNQPTLIEGGG